MNIVSSYIHALEGRLRIKIPEVKGAPARAQEVERHLYLLIGMEEVSANPVTGNVLLLYNSGLLQLEQIIAALQELGYLEEAPSRQRHPAAAASPSGLAGHLASAVGSTLMEMALSSLVAALI